VLPFLSHLCSLRKAIGRNHPIGKDQAQHIQLEAQVLSKLVSKEF
jgi:hypothetical protein